LAGDSARIEPACRVSAAQGLSPLASESRSGWCRTGVRLLIDNAVMVATLCWEPDLKAVKTAESDFEMDSLIIIATLDSIGRNQSSAYRVLGRASFRSHWLSESSPQER